MHFIILLHLFGSSLWLHDAPRFTLLRLQGTTRHPRIPRHSFLAICGFMQVPGHDDEAGGGSGDVDGGGKGGGGALVQNTLPRSLICRTLIASKAAEFPTSEKPQLMAVLRAT